MNLYRRRIFPASSILLALTLVLISLSFGQQDGITTSYRRPKPHKLRATGLLTLARDSAGNTTAKLTPIVILDQGQFEDASIYEARPEPMALDKGVVYEAQKSGVPVGYVTLFSSSNQGIWTALGKWQPITQEAKKSEPPKQAQSDDSSDGRPILHRPDSGAASAASTPTPPPVAQPTPTPEPEEAEDTDRPVLRHTSPGTTSEPGTAPNPSSTPAPAAQSTLPAGTAGVQKPGAQTFVAVSDAQASDTRSYQFVFKPGDQEKAEEKMRKLALAQLPPENSKLNENSMKNVVIRAFDLDLSNDAIMVLTAEVPGSYVTPATKGAPGKFVSRYLTLIARLDFQGDLQRLSASVTDSSRLDVAPRLELIDAVDVDGDGFAELLFREYSFDQKGFIVYGIGRGGVTKVFEGASSPLQ